MSDAFTLLAATCDYDQPDDMRRDKWLRALRDEFRRLVDKREPDLTGIRKFISAVAESDIDPWPDVRRDAEIHFVSISRAIRRAMGDDEELLLAALRKLTRPYKGPASVKLYKGQLEGQPFGICWTNKLDAAAVIALSRSMTLGKPHAYVIYEVDAPPAAVISCLEQFPRIREVTFPKYLVDRRALPSPPIAVDASHVYDALARVPLNSAGLKGVGSFLR